MLGLARLDSRLARLAEVVPPPQGLRRARAEGEASLVTRLAARQARLDSRLARQARLAARQVVPVPGEEWVGVEGEYIRVEDLEVGVAIKAKKETAD